VKILLLVEFQDVKLILRKMAFVTNPIHTHSLLMTSLVHNQQPKSLVTHAHPTP